MSNIDYFIDYVSPDERFALKIEGWAYDTEGNDMTFRLTDDNGDPVEMTVHRKDRVDVVRELEDKNVPLKAGFICKIRNIDLLREKNIKTLHLQAGLKEFQTIYDVDVEKYYNDSILYVFLDKSKMVNKEVILIGWTYNLFSEEKLKITDENGNRVPFRINRFVRDDVNRVFGLDRKKKTGFEIRISGKDAGNGTLYLCAVEGDIVKSIPIDVKKMRHDSSRMVKLWNTYGPGKLMDNYRFIREYGMDEFKNRALAETDVTDRSGYELWRERHVVKEKELSAQRKHVFAYTPKISIAVPLYNTPVGFLKELIDSFIAQSYGNWELCLADGSNNQTVEEYIAKAYEHEKRIAYKHLEVNAGISENTNEAIRLASGDYIMFSDHDDFIEPDTLFEIVKAINEDRNTDVLYTDEDKVTMDSKNYYDPHFKPDFNQFLLCSNNYITHIFVVNREIIDEVGMLRSEYDGAQDYDFILRCCEKAKKIHHIPKILYHWRNHPASTAGNPESKLYAYQAGVKSVQAHYDRLGIPAEVSMTDRLGHYRTRFVLDDRKKVSIIVPSSGNEEMDLFCISTIRKNTEYSNYEVLFCLGEEDIPKRKQIIVDPENRIRYIPWKQNHDFSAMCNYSAELAEGEYILLLENTREILTPGWIKDMLGYCSQEKIGAVGARLLYENEFIHHAGIVPGLGRDRVGAHLLHMQPDSMLSYQCRGETVQNIGAVSTECIMLKKSVFQMVNGLDTGYKGIYRSIDFSLKIREKGFELIYDPKVVLKVFESLDKTQFSGRAERKEDQLMAEQIRQKWENVLSKTDPYYNPNFSKIYTDYSIGY